MKELRILVVEDSTDDAELVRRVLSKSFQISRFVRVDNENAFRTHLEASNWDLILSDYNLPNFRAEEALAFVRRTQGELPFILVSGGIGEEAAVELLKMGADDVVLKNNLSRLAISIDRALRSVHIRMREEQAQQTADRALRDRERMLAVVSHDLRNPLSAIQLNAETILEKFRHASTFEQAHAVLAHADSIVRSSLRMKSLIADVLDKARLETGNFRIHITTRSLNEFLQEVADLFLPLAIEKKQQFEVNFPKQNAECNLDFERLHQILSNLLGNALKFTPSGGRITLEASLKDGEIEFIVKDNGPGIETDNLDSIFEKYWQNHRTGWQGLGLGLSIVKDLVKAHGGKIWVETEKGFGTCFGIHLPCQWKKASQPILKNRKTENPWVCVVDDDDDLREILQSSLEDLGYRVTSFSTGQSAVDGLSHIHSLPDLMIMDFRLPDMNGGEVIDQLRPQLSKRKVPVIFLSAEANLHTLARQHQASAFLAKPLRLRELAKAIEFLL